jgi:hypothetical protein
VVQALAMQKSQACDFSQKNFHPNCASVMIDFFCKSCTLERWLPEPSRAARGLVEKNERARV